MENELNSYTALNKKNKVVTNDVYRFIGEYLLKHNFYDLSVEKQKNVVGMAFKDYFLKKFNKKLSYDSYVMCDVEDLLIIFAAHFKEEERDVNIDPLVHCLMNIMGNMQGYSMMWEVSSDEELKERPVIIQNSSTGIWEQALTHDEACPIHVFRHLYTQFINSFMNQIIPKH